MTTVFAQTLTYPGGVVQGPVAFTKVGSVVAAAIPFVFAFSGIALLLMLIAAGFDFVTSAGDPKNLEMGKQRLTYAIVGFLVIFVSYWMVQLAGIVFGIQEIQSAFPWH